jgi:hypothetical protein
VQLTQHLCRAARTLPKLDRFTLQFLQLQLQIQLLSLQQRIEFTQLRGTRSQKLERLILRAQLFPKFMHVRSERLQGSGIGACARS